MKNQTAEVHRTTDPLEAELLLDALREEGLSARLIGTRRAALIGAAQHITPVRIEVPLDQAEQARELITALLTPPSPEELEAEAEAAQVAPETAEPLPCKSAAEHVPPRAAAPPPSRRNPLLALGAAFVFPGGSHLYVRRPWTAALLGPAFLAALVIAASQRGVTATTAAFLVAGVLLADLLGAQWSLRKAAAPRPRPVRQLGAGLLGLLLAGIASWLLAAYLLPALERRGPEQVRALEEERLPAGRQLPGDLPPWSPPTPRQLPVEPLGEEDAQLIELLQRLSHRPRSGSGGPVPLLPTVDPTGSAP